MMRNFFIALAIVSVVGFGVVASPIASAQTADEIRVQIEQLLAQVEELKRQLAQLTTTTVQPDPTLVPKHRICNIIYRNMAPGTQGDDVVSLQEYLKSEGYFSANATGYFGPMTAQAVAKWQSSQGVAAVGSFGPMSRERVKVWCGTADRFSATPQRGAAPLMVQFSAKSSEPYGGLQQDRYSIDFGDGTEEFLGVVPFVGGGPSALMHTTHTYTSNGTYTAVLYQNNRGGCSPEAEAQGCLGPPASHTAIAKLQIHVGPVACTKEYKPVCGSKPIVCITTPCNPIQQTYGNRCEMNADGASFLYEGACKRIEPISCPIPMCMLIGCPDGQHRVDDSPIYNELGCRTNHCAGRCVPNDTTNRPPTISGFSGPTTLAVNASGTWTVNASDPENGNLTYSVDWGDVAYLFNSAPASAMREAFVQATTFTHSYASAGTYQVAIAVRDSAGQEAKTSSTVNVGTATTAICPGPKPTTQCNGMWEIGYKTDNYYGDGCTKRWACQPVVACTADAMQCPDGSWVGRTGPNCQFVCPGNTVSTNGDTSIATIEKGTQCTTPWGNQIVGSGNQVSSQPYFTNGQYTFSVTVPKMLCSMGKWLRCDYQGNSCIAY